MSAAALQNLLDYLTATLNASNRRWLAEHLLDVEPSDKQKTAQETYVCNTLTKALTETKAAFGKGKSLPNAYDLLNEL